MTCLHHWLLGVLAGLPPGQALCKSCGITKPMPDVYIDIQHPWPVGKEKRPAIVWTREGREI